MQIALWQCLSEPLDTHGNLQRLRNAASQAKAAGAELLVTPEMYLSGYNISLAAANQQAQHRDGPLAIEVADIARSLDIAILYGYPEKDGQGALYNSVQLIDEHGTSLANYRKTHLFGALDRTLFSAGAEHSPVVPFKGWHIGLLICYDLEFPENARRLAVAGADLILVPTANMQPFEFIANITVRSRAFENQCFIAYANYCGDEGGLVYCGLSSIVGPAGQVLTQAGDGPEMILARLERSALADARKSNCYLADRRTDLFEESPINQRVK